VEDKIMLVELIEKLEHGLLKETEKEDYTTFKECNCKLIKIKAMSNHWALFFKNNNSFFKLPIYRLPEFDNKDFTSYKVNSYYNIKFKIENAIVENVLKEKEE
jgi:hypothetical protein